MRLKSTVKHRYELHLQIEELNNIPQLSGTAFCKITISKHNKAVKFQDFTKHVDIKNNKSHLDYSLVKPFKIYQDVKKNCLLDLNLSLEFFSELSHSHKTKLGSLKINLIEFLKYDHYHTVRYLLQDSKINSILKVSIFWISMDSSSPINDGISPHSLLRSSSTTLNNQLPDDVIDTSTHDLLGRQSIDSVRSKQNGFIKEPPINEESEEEEEIHKLNKTKTKTSYLDTETTILSNPKLLKLISDSFQIPWNNEYDEFTPAEAINDIFDNNGLGFRKNEEGLLLIDLFANQKLKMDLTDVRRNSSGLKYLSGNEYYSSSEEDEDNEDEEEGRSKKIDDEMDFDWRKLVKNSYHGRKKKKISRQVDEKEIRPDLKSWVINN